jgi:hypothetical protein
MKTPWVYVHTPEKEREARISEGFVTFESDPELYEVVERHRMERECRIAQGVITEIDLEIQEILDRLDQMQLEDVK